MPFSLGELVVPFGSYSMLNLLDIRRTLVSQMGNMEDLPCHVAAFCAWITGDQSSLAYSVDVALNFTGQGRHPQHVAALGYGTSSGLLDNSALEVLREEVQHLGGRSFFSTGRPWRFEVDGAALLGVSVGVSVACEEADRRWLLAMLRRSTNELSGDEWQCALVMGARLLFGEENVDLRMPELAVALQGKGVGIVDNEDFSNAWSASVGLCGHSDGATRDAARIATFDLILERQKNISLVRTSKTDLILLLQNMSRSMRLWRFEAEPRTKKSEIARWEVENEYHVQSLLWTVLAPIFADLEDEENLPSIGHKHPRADLGIPSIGTIVEVKFLKRTGNMACAKLIEEIAADASLYLSSVGSTPYREIVVFVWDDCRQTEQYHELKSGLEAISGVSGAIILPRPEKMVRS